MDVGLCQMLSLQVRIHLILFICVFFSLLLGDSGQRFVNFVYIFKDPPALGNIKTCLIKKNFKYSKLESRNESLNNIISEELRKNLREEGILTS